jgi:hypothetical protein
MGFLADYRVSESTPVLRDKVTLCTQLCSGGWQPMLRIATAPPADMGAGVCTSSRTCERQRVVHVGFGTCT